MRDTCDELDRALAAHRAGDLRTAEAIYLTILDNRSAAYNLAIIYGARGRHADAEALLSPLVEADPGWAPACNALSKQLLMQGRYAQAWPLHEGRRSDPAIPRLSLPEWIGDDLAGRHILVMGEQGFGDQIMFARFLEPLRARAGRVSLVIGTALASLLAHPEMDVVAARADARMPQSDCWTLICSLPGLMGVTLETLPPPVRLDVTLGAGGGIGVVTRGRPSHYNDAHRSLDPAAASRLLALGRDLAPEATGARDFRETAEIVAGLDLVISVDTAIAHLAASLGKPTWILLPAFGADWRWMTARSDSPWYPSARLFRQQAPGDWSSVLDRVEQVL